MGQHFVHIVVNFIGIGLSPHFGKFFLKMKYKYKDTSVIVCVCAFAADAAHWGTSHVYYIVEWRNVYFGHFTDIWFSIFLSTIFYNRHSSCPHLLHDFLSFFSFRHNPNANHSYTKIEEMMQTIPFGLFENDCLSLKLESFSQSVFQNSCSVLHAALPIISFFIFVVSSFDRNLGFETQTHRWKETIIMIRNNQLVVIDVDR